MSVTIYCDGSGTTGGPAGVGYVAIIDDVESEGSLPLPNATNQQAEILAAAYALDQIEPTDSIVVYSDSEYLVLAMQGRLDRWIARGWRTTSGAVKNRRHWERLLAAVERHDDVEFRWVRGHADCAENNRADELAVAARHAARAA